MAWPPGMTTETASLQEEAVEPIKTSFLPRMEEVDASKRTGPGPGRKSRACSECRKQKMKCEILPGDRKCRHCLRRNVECILKRATEPDVGERYSEPSSQSYEYKLDAMRDEIRQMKRCLDAVLRVQDFSKHQFQDSPATSVPKAYGLRTITSPPEGTSPAKTTISTREDNMHMAMTRENSLEPIYNNEQTNNGPVAVEEPMGSLYEVTRLRNIRSNRANTVRQIPEDEGELNDFISRGVISEAEAEEFYNIFHTTLNHYLWVGLEQTHPTFNSVRQSSELLTATILTVTALHIPTSAETFDNCYKEFLSLISSSMFSRYHSVDDVRGLCIAAFWLSEVSWKLSGHAIRIATELSIHQSFAKALSGDREHFLRARLWYMLYVCDHHFSIAYGRPPMIAESPQIREHERFLTSPFAGPLDYRILSQVDLMQILTRVYHRFAEGRRLSANQQPAQALNSSNRNNFNNVANGYDQSITNKKDTANSRGSGGAAGGSGMTTSMLAETDFADLRNFNLEIDQWRVRWYVRQVNNPYIGSFPPKGIILYSYFAKLQVNSLAVRGVSLSQQGKLSTERKEFANMAISAAASILTFVLEEEDLRRALVGTPLYVHTMIAFASDTYLGRKLPLLTRLEAKIPSVPVFLMKVATQWNRAMGLSVECSYVSHLLGRMIVLLKGSVTSDRHLLYHIAAGLEKMLANMQQALDPLTITGDVAVNGDSTTKGPDQATGPRHEPPEYRAAMRFGRDEPMQGEPESLLGSGSATTQAWGTSENEDGQDLFGDLTLMNDNLIYEAFGSESTNNVYNLLSSQFSY